MTKPPPKSDPPFSVPRPDAQAPDGPRRPPTDPPPGSPSWLWELKRLDEAGLLKPGWRLVVELPEKK